MTSEPATYCPNCQGSLRLGARFCGHCGGKIGAVEADPKPAQRVADRHYYAPAPAPTRPVYADEPVYSEGPVYGAAYRPRRNTKAIVAIVFGLLLLGLALILVTTPVLKYGSESVTLGDLNTLCGAGGSFTSSLGPCQAIAGIMGFAVVSGILGLILLVFGLSRLGRRSPDAGYYAAQPRAQWEPAQPRMAAAPLAGSQGFVPDAGTVQQPAGSYVTAAAPAQYAPLENPFVAPTSQAGWMVGAGSLLAAVSVLLPWQTYSGRNYSGFDTPINIVVGLGLLAVAATQFLAPRVPTFRTRSLIVLWALSVGFGIGVAQGGFGQSYSGSLGVGAMLFMGGLAVASLGAAMIRLSEESAAQPATEPEPDSASPEQAAPSMAQALPSAK